MKKILVLDTSIVSKNTGDSIIMDAVYSELKEIFHSDMFFNSITHDRIWRTTYSLNRISDFTLVGGTNLLSSNMNSYNQWKINMFDSLFLKGIILMGVGWHVNPHRPNMYTEFLLKKVLNRQYLHSVRDSQAESLLRSIGISNVLNTGCMTMWRLTNEHCSKIPKSKADSVVFTLTDYSKDYVKDQMLIDILIKKYEKVYFWPQGNGDLDYLAVLKNTQNIVILGANLWSFDVLICDHSKNLEYIGTRLHAGIRALQKARRSLIIGIDNRAQAMAADFNLNVLSRNDLSNLNKIISNDIITEIRLNEDNILTWKRQFQ